jgi:hypothetical protein
VPRFACHSVISAAALAVAILSAADALAATTPFTYNTFFAAIAAVALTLMLHSLLLSPLLPRFFLPPPLSQ